MFPVEIPKKKGVSFRVEMSLEEEENGLDYLWTFKSRGTISALTGLLGIQHDPFCRNIREKLGPPFY
jgi:predicted glycosyltransferase